MNAPHPDWRQLFDRAVADAGGVLQTVADQMGVSRTTVSLVVNGKYHARLDKFARRVVAIYDRFECPHLESRITAAECQAFALRPAPTSSAREARHWRACQACAHKPNVPEDPTQ